MQQRNLLELYKDYHTATQMLHRTELVFYVDLARKGYLFRYLA